MNDFLRDIRLAFRQLARTPGFAAVALLTLALGIGSSAAMFSAVDALLLRALPYTQGDRLVALWTDGTRREMPRTEWTNSANFHDWRAQSKTISDMFAYAGSQATLTGRGDPEQINSLRMTWSGFDVLGVRPQLGRGFVESDDVPNGPRNIVVSDRFWRNQLGTRGDVLGSSATFDGQPYTVVGVLPAGFEFPTLAGRDVYVCLQQGPDEARGGFYLRTIGRLADGATLEQAQQELALIMERLVAAHPDANKDLGMYVETLRDAMSGSARTQLLVLFGATLLVLLIACANLANLLLARTAYRGRELAVRTALGAARFRLVRQLLAESLVLGVLGGACGVALCFVIVGWLARALPDGAAAATPLVVDARVLGFAALTAIVCAAVFGAAPALAAGGLDINTELRDGDRGAAGGRRAARLRTALVVGNFALALTLTIGAGLFLKSLERLAAVDPGFRAERLFTFQLGLDPETYKESPKAVAMHAALVEKLGALPGVESAALTSTLPLAGDNTDTNFRLAEQQADPDAKPVRAWYSIVSPGYLATLGIAVRKGRGFETGDRAEAPLAVVVNQAFERTHFPGGAVGQRLATGPVEKPNYWQIIGVADDVRFFGLDQPQTPALYLALAQRPARTFYVALRTRAADPGAMLGAARRAVAELDPALAVGSPSTMEALREGSMRNQRLAATLVGAFSALALALAAVGVYGIAAFTVAQRTREFGVRMALGASRRRLVELVLAHAVRVAALGVLVGLLLAAALGRTLASLLYEVKPFDPSVFAVVCALLLVVALVATLAPALRASRVDPMTALRYE